MNHIGRRRGDAPEACKIYVSIAYLAYVDTGAAPDAWVACSSGVTARGPYVVKTLNRPTSHAGDGEARGSKVSGQDFYGISRIGKNSHFKYSFKGNSLRNRAKIAAYCAC